jgi:2-polyprenyl-6-methoxyphenol hydroxylase-like FAD-dependent oxidoreductase
MTVLIAGGGIGGLATALSLHQIGIACRVLESVEVVSPLGVGINLLPHAVRELEEMGLLEALAATAIETAELAYFSKRGQPIWQEPRGRAAGYRWPQLSIHRGELQMILLAAVRARLGAAAVVTGAPVVAWSETPEGVEVVTRQRDTGQEDRHRGHLLVAADGIHSAVRASLYPGEGPPLWNGAVLWRGVTHGAPFLTGRSMIMAGHERQKFVAYPISRAAYERGEAVVNWVAERKFRPDHTWRREDWNRPGRLEEFLPAFADWRFGWLDVPGLIRAAERVFEYPMVDRDPLPRWTHGRVTLLGDAAHPMYPIGSNGASQALLDARVLAREILRHGPTEAALQAYEAERLPATARIVLANRGNGPEQVMQLVEERAPEGYSDIAEVLTAAELEGAAAAYKRLAGFDREALEARGPIVPAVTPGAARHD